MDPRIGTSAIAANLSRLRLDQGLGVGALAARAGLSRKAYRDLEHGRTAPRVRTLERLARALSVRVDELLAPARALEHVRLRTRRPLKRRPALLHRVQRELADLCELERLLSVARPSSLGAHAKPARADRVAESPSPDPVQAACDARRRFGLDDREPVHDLCGLLEAHGIAVLCIPLESDAFLGLSVGERDGGPAIVVNTWARLPVEARIWSAARQLGHLWMHPGAHDVRQRAEHDDEEREANAFALHFLLPPLGFREAWEAGAGLPLSGRVLRVKRLFRVGWRAVALRMGDDLTGGDRRLWLDVFNGDFAELNRWQRARAGRAASKKLRAPAGRAVEPAPLDEHDFVPTRRSLLVRRAVEEGRISLARAAEILGVPLLEMRRIARAWNG